VLPNAVIWSVTNDRPGWLL